MRGEDNKQEAMFSYVSPEKRVPTDHPLRPIRAMVDGILKEMSPQFAKRYADVGRPSIAPERLLRVLLLQIFYSVRSERLLMEQLRYNLLFRWFVGMEMDEEVWNHAVFSKNRERLLNEEIAEAFFQRVLVLAQPYLSDEHFTVDGTRIEAWASQKSFRRKDDPGDQPGASGKVDFHGEKRGNETHQSTTDPEARLYKKSKGSEAKLSYLGHVLIENRHRRMHITPHVAQNHTNRCSAIDRRTTRHIGYELSQQKRKRVEQSFGWMKVIGMLKKVKLRGLEKVGWLFTFTGAAYNLCRLRNLQVQAVG